MRALRLVAICLLLAACAGGGGGTLRSGAAAEDVATPPRLVNGDEVAEAIRREYPPYLRAQGVSGTVRLQLLVGTDGMPGEVRILQSSGNDELDQAATRVASLLRFEPATDARGRPLQVWASYPIPFR